MDIKKLMEDLEKEKKPTSQEKFAKALVLTLIAIGTIIVVAVLLTLPTFFLWNWLMPVIFKLPELTLWQALGVTLLSGVLFKSSPSASKK